MPLGREGKEREGGREGCRREREGEEEEEEKEEGRGKQRRFRKRRLWALCLSLPTGEQRPGLGSQTGQCQARWAYALDYYQDRRPSLCSRSGLINQFLSSNHMDIPQLRGLASVGPARAALVEGRCQARALKTEVVIEA